jgi:hypothetical protein
MDTLQTTVDAVSSLITTGIKPLPSLLGYSVFDVAGSLRLALVLRQIRDAERVKALKLQSKLTEQSKDARELEEQNLVTDLMTILVRSTQIPIIERQLNGSDLWYAQKVVVYGGELICCESYCPIIQGESNLTACPAPWLQFTPSFLTMPHYPLLLAVTQVIISMLPMVPSMSIYTELPLSFLDALTRAFHLTTGNSGFIVQHASPSIASSPWVLLIVSPIMANGGFFLVNVFQMLSPYGWHVKTPPEFLPGGWRTMDLWIAPLITGVNALLTQSQAAWIPYHRHIVQRVGRSTMFGALEYAVTESRESKGSVVADIKPMGEVEARSICALVLCALFAYRAVINFGIDWACTSDALRVKRKRIIRSSKYHCCLPVSTTGSFS